STLAVVALNNARQKSRDAKRVSDIKQVQTALELYYNDANSYPATAAVVFGTGSISYGSPATTYMAILPSNPSPRNDGSCPNIDYAYSQNNGGASYSITYCLGGATGGLTAGTKRATPAGISN
ncbi:MAG: hypothetical protein PHQ42_04775, partial [Patescibacteria group bacterium]|nr:hypothetical protein [Patescibacteria group bacterium]